MGYICMVVFVRFNLLYIRKVVQVQQFMSFFVSLEFFVVVLRGSVECSFQYQYKARDWLGGTSVM